MSSRDDMVESLRALGRRFAELCPPGFGFAVWLFGHYLSNGDRADIRKTVFEWLARNRAATAADVPLTSLSGAKPEPGESPEAFAKRKRIEVLCETVGDALLMAAPNHFDRTPVFLLMMFEFGAPGGALAWRMGGDPRALGAMLGAWLDMSRPGAKPLG